MYSGLHHNVKSRQATTSLVRSSEGKSSQVKSSQVKSLGDAHLEAQADEATAALARKHKEQEVIVARAKKAEAEAEELREKMEIVTEAVTKATTCAAEAETALETIKASATQLTNELHERRNDLRNLLEDKVSKQSAKFAELAGSSVTAMHKAATDGAAATAEALNGAGEAQGKLLDGHQIMLTESVQSLEEASKSSVTRISAALKETTEMRKTGPVTVTPRGIRETRVQTRTGARTWTSITHLRPCGPPLRRPPGLPPRPPP